MAGRWDDSGHPSVPASGAWGCAPQTRVRGLHPFGLPPSRRPGPIPPRPFRVPEMDQSHRDELSVSLSET